MTGAPKAAVLIDISRGEDARVWNLQLGGKTLLARAIETAQAARCMASVSVITSDAAAQRLAKSLGAMVGTGCIPPADEAHRASAEALFTASPAYPFLTPGVYDAMFVAMHERGASRAGLLVRQRHHPMGAFIARQGVMDFSATLAHPRWRDFDGSIYYQPLPALKLRRRGAGSCEAGVLPVSGTANDESTLEGRAAYLEADEIAALRVRGPADLDLARRILSRGVWHADQGGKPWRAI